MNLMTRYTFPLSGGSNYAQLFSDQHLVTVVANSNMMSSERSPLVDQDFTTCISRLSIYLLCSDDMKQLSFNCEVTHVKIKFPFILGEKMRFCGL